jgi:Flp pilus assembly CpaE family ATPase
MKDKSILLIEPDRKTATFIHHMLSNAGYKVEIAPTGKEGLIIAWRDQPDIIVTELDLPDIEGIELIQKFRQDHRTKKTPLYGFTAQSNPEITVGSMDAGLDHLIVKQSDAVDELLRQLSSEEIIPQVSHTVSGPPQRGALTIFLGVKGGVGTSSICLNVAHQLSKLDPETSIAVCDLVLPIGSLATITGSQSEIDLNYLSSMSVNELNPDFLHQHLPTPHGWSFKIVQGPPDPFQAAELNSDRLASILQVLRNAYDHVILDIGRNLSALALVALTQADAVITVLIPEPECVANALAIHAFLEEAGIDDPDILLVTNRPLPSEGFSTETAAGALGKDVDVAVPNMGADLQLANSLHAPLYLRFPEERVTRSLDILAAKIQSIVNRD